MKAGTYKTSFLGSDYPFHYIDDKSKAIKAIKTLLSHQGTLSIDTETEILPAYKYDKTAGLNPYLSRVRLLQIFTGEEAYIFDIKKIDKDTLFLQFLSGKNFVGHNSVFDIQYFVNQFKVVDMSIGCTMLAAKLLFHALFPSDAGLSASLRNLVNVTFGAELLKEMQVSDWSEPELTFEQVEYSALDVVSTYFLAKRLALKLKKYGLTRVYNLYKDAQVSIARLQLNGIKLDVDAHRDNIVTWRAELYKAKKDLLKLTGIEHVTAAQIGNYLENTLPYNVLSIWPKTETGKLQTDSHVFADFDWIDIVKPLAEYKKKEKLCTSFGHTLINMVNPVTKRLHAQYKLAGARTGRLSCSNPNNQQYPRDKKFRSLFMPEPGRIFLCADYSQIEIRVAAELSRDKAMLHAYKNGIDLHAQTASIITGKPINKVTKEDRQMAKAFNFGLMFGLGSAKFSHYAKKSYGAEVSQEEAEGGIKTFRETYSGYRTWQLAQAAKAKNNLIAITPCGKLRKLEEKSYYGACMNTPVQGGASECMLHALIRLNKKLTEQGTIGKIVNIVHDEVLVETVEKNADYIKEAINDSMTQGFLDVFPGGITRDITAVGKGNNWAEAKV
jgi:DNA polymerase I